jgi:hypothetical protein
MSRENVASSFNRSALARICKLSERSFGRAFDLEKVTVPADQWVSAPDNIYYHGDRGSNILAVAHLDTVVRPDQRTARFIHTDAGEVVYSGALDDRLGAYIILDLLPELGITCDILLTTGEESGQSTAQFFQPSKDYDWLIEFDRGGTDVVLYQYDDMDTAALVEESGAIVGTGIFSDICYLDHLGVKGFNWGTGYRDYHSVRSHAYLDDTFDMVASFERFYHANVGVRLDHEPARSEYDLCLGELDELAELTEAELDDYFISRKGWWNDVNL